MLAFIIWKKMSNIDIQQDYLSKNRSSHQEMFHKTVVFKHFARLTVKHLWSSLNKIESTGPFNSFKQRLQCSCFHWILWSFQEHLFCRAPQKCSYYWRFPLFCFLEEKPLEFIKRASQPLHLFIRLSSFVLYNSENKIYLSLVFFINIAQALQKESHCLWYFVCLNLSYGQLISKIFIILLAYALFQYSMRASAKLLIS